MFQKKIGGGWMGRVEVKMAVVLLCALQNFLFQFIFVKMREEVPLSCSWDKVGIEGLSSQLKPN